MEMTVLGLYLSLTTGHTTGDVVNITTDDFTTQCLSGSQLKVSCIKIMYTGV
uniref:Uncharacterized protein n=1 Tax=Arion vulgaris TaxID=1028688 RepID=A0A0B7AVF0_9EUPU